ncbi:hypothetical protein [Rhizobium ruizarguesonis]|uniref:hypothetical protein n=1 Tax=Rhizobium ruizarguesonis TaxID=2081791 RepID=UPI001FDF4C04|nr:hypothetical protein [Rhizobium ruizarguesonis]
MANEPSDDMKEIEAIVEAIKPHLAGHPAELQGAAIADLMAIFLAGMAPEMREEAIEFHVDLVRQLIPVEESIAFGAAGHPARQESEG